MPNLMQLKASRPLILSGLVLLFLALALVPPVARADYVVYDTQVDAYHITVFARPNPISVGKVNLLIRLGRQENIAQEYPVRSAKVTVQFKQLSGPGTQPNSQIDTYHKELVAKESEPGTYEMEDSLLSEGRYQAIIKLDSSVGKSQTAFEFTAKPQPDDRFFSVLLLAMFPLGLLTLVYLYVRRPKDSAGGSDTAVAPPNPEPEEASRR